MKKPNMIRQHMMMTTTMKNNKGKGNNIGTIGSNNNYNRNPQRRQQQLQNQMLVNK